MTLGLRSILLIVAVVLFLIAAVADGGSDMIAFGLAAFAASFVVGDLPMGDRRR